jgi:hypothetical protein
VKDSFPALKPKENRNTSRGQRRALICSAGLPMDKFLNRAAGFLQHIAQEKKKPRKYFK